RNHSPPKRVTTGTRDVGRAGRSALLRHLLRQHGLRRCYYTQAHQGEARCRRGRQARAGKVSWWPEAARPARRPLPPPSSFYAEDGERTTYAHGTGGKLVAGQVSRSPQGYNGREPRFGYNRPCLSLRSTTPATWRVSCFSTPGISSRPTRPGRNSGPTVPRP